MVMIEREDYMPGELKRRLTLMEDELEEDVEGDEADKVSTLPVDADHNDPPFLDMLAKSLMPNPDDDEKLIQRKSIYSRIRETIPKQRKISEMEGDDLLEMYQLNENGFVKRKEMKVLTKNSILGLQSYVDKKESIVFETLFGEELVKYVEKDAYCEHNFKIDYLKKINSKFDDAFHRQFQFLTGKVVLTNYRLIFITAMTGMNATLMRKQPNFVKEFFNIPLGFINRVERSVNIHQDPSQQNKYNAYSNQP